MILTHVHTVILLLVDYPLEGLKERGKTFKFQNFKCQNFKWKLSTSNRSHALYTLFYSVPKPVYDLSDSEFYVDDPKRVDTEREYGVLRA